MIITMMLVFFVLLFLGIPVALAMGIGAVSALLMDPSLPGFVMVQTMHNAMNSFALMAIPFFMLAGQLMEHTGITASIVKFADSIVGHIKGGLGHTVMVTGVLLAGVSGSSNADASAIGSMMVPTMIKSGYDDGFTCNVVATSSALGPIIPPSITAVIYCSVASITVAEVFMAGYIPGFIIAGLCMAVCYIYAKKKDLSSHKFLGLKNVISSLWHGLPALMLPIIIIGGILSGVFTATEAGVMACVYAIAYGFITKNINLVTFKECLLNAGINTAVPLFIIGIANVFGVILTRNNLSAILSNFITGITDSPYVFLILVAILLLFLGMFIDATATMLMLVPILTPMLEIYGINPLHFAMVFLISLEAGGLTPPVGLTLYIVCSTSGVPFRKCVKWAWVFTGIMYAVVAAIIFFPAIVTFIPNLVL